MAKKNFKKRDPLQLFAEKKETLKVVKVSLETQVSLKETQLVAVGQEEAKRSGEDKEKFKRSRNQNTKRSRGRCPSQYYRSSPRARGPRRPALQTPSRRGSPG